MGSFLKNKILVIVFIVTGLLSLHGQSEKTYSFVSYSNKDGFDQNTVLNIEQDKYNDLWIGTANGLIKYDGNAFQNVSWQSKYQNDIYHGPIRTILSDSNGLLWIVSRSGLNIYYPDKDQFFKTTSDSMDIFFNAVEDDDGSMWVMGDGCMYNVKTELSQDTIVTSWSPNIFASTHADLNARNMIKISADLYLLASTSGLYRVNFTEDLTKPIIERETLIPATIVSSIVNYNNMIWIGTRQGLYKTVLDGSKLRYIDKFIHVESDINSISDNHIFDLMVSSDNSLWVATRKGGLCLFNTESETFTSFLQDPTKKGKISSNRTSCIFEDSFNVLWIGTTQGGLNKLDLNQKQFINIEHNPYNSQTIPSNLVNHILEDKEGYLWIASFNSPLCRSNKPVTETNLSELTFSRFRSWHKNGPGRNIISTFEDDKGYIWLGYENGAVAVYNKGKGTFQNAIFESNGSKTTIQNIHSILYLDDETILFSGSKVLAAKNPWKHLNNNSSFRLPVEVLKTFQTNREIIKVSIEDPKSIWIGFLKNGLTKYALEGDSLVMTDHYELNEDDPFSISSNSVFSILKDKNEDFWIGTFGGGLNKMIDYPQSNRTGFELFRDSSGQINNAIYGIIEENDSILWCGTDMGISRINTRSYRLTSYSIPDGVASNNFRMNAYHKGKSAYFYFGGLNGLTVFKPEHIKPSTIPPVVRITGLKINNKPVLVGESVSKRNVLDKHISEVSELELTRNARTIAFEINTYHSSVPEKNRLSYYLEGFDEEWIDVSQGSFAPTYTNLESGNYTFKVIGYNCDGIPSEQETSLQITMLAPWFARPLSILFFFIFGISIITGVSIYLVKLKNLQNSLHFEQIDKERIQEVNKSKLTFFTNISHEFKTPLSLISIPLSKLKEIVKGSEEREYVEMIEKNSNRLIRLMDQLLTFRRIEHGGDVLNISKTSLDDLIYPVADAFESLSEKKGIQFYYMVKDPAFMIHVDLEKMEQVLFNLLSNAFKFTPANGKIRLEGSIHTIKDRQYASFDVKDSGAGIQTEDLSKIFDRFYQSGSELRNMGTGIGLSYSKSIVELHKGSISVKSALGKGTTFSILLPLNELKLSDKGETEVKRLNAIELLEYEKISSNINSVEESNNNLKPTVLIADDEDEFRRIIKGVLKKNYRILEAPNGLDAMEIATSGELDLIISDVMMPGMNGYDFCKKVKSDIQLCHIPFILLTALEEMDNHIEGVEHGADSYISKPFNLKHLEASVKSLIENRKKLKEHFTKTHLLPKDVQISGIDSAFIELVNKAIQENLVNSSFGVEELAREANLSTSQLYRKLKFLTGQIPNAYLRNYRLQAAADLLAGNPGISVKTVMYAVGIESASHFSHAFKKKFGYSPSEFS